MLRVSPPQPQYDWHGINWLGIIQTINNVPIPVLDRSWLKNTTTAEHLIPTPKFLVFIYYEFLSWGVCNEKGNTVPICTWSDGCCRWLVFDGQHDCFSLKSLQAVVIACEIIMCSSSCSFTSYLAPFVHFWNSIYYIGTSIVYPY
jgi:hypothetical protein